jgi:DNA-binding response OmpR family regulator
MSPETTHSHNILIVDDEDSIRFIMERTLAHGSYLVKSTGSGTDALKLLEKEHFHLVLLDLHMQPLSGIQVLTEIRKNNQETEVIILTGHSDIESAIEALRLGAFDYLMKPVQPDIVRQRVATALKRYDQNLYKVRLREQIASLQSTLQALETNVEPEKEHSGKGGILRKGPLTIDTAHRKAILGEEELDLTTTEYKLLLDLAKASPKTVSACDLAASVLGYECSPVEAGELVKFHIHHLRQKVEPDPQKPRYIKTVRFEGYLWTG